MAKDYVVIKGQANIIRNETAEGGNTAAEVGGAIYDVADKLEEVDGTLTSAIGTKLPISSVVDNLTSTHTAAPLSANQGKVLNDNKADKTTQVVAGNGLTGGGSLSGDVTVNVSNTDDSIVVGADGIKVDTQNSLTSTSTTKPLSAAQGKALQENKVDTSRTITAGNGLTGGGNLTDDRAINVVNTDDSIVVSADGIKVDTQDTLTSDSVSKPLSAKQGKSLQDNKAEKTRTITAGAGLTGGGDLTADRTINIANADDSLVVSADSIKVNTNNTLTSTSTTQPLSANQGKVLNEKVAQVETDLNTLDNTINGRDNSVSFEIPVIAAQTNDYKSGSYNNVLIKSGSYNMAYDNTYLGAATYLYVTYANEASKTYLNILNNLSTITLPRDVIKVEIYATASNALKTGNCLFNMIDTTATYGIQAVEYSEQQLTTKQKSIARNNIDVASKYGLNKSVNFEFDVTQAMLSGGGTYFYNCEIKAGNYALSYNPSKVTGSLLIYVKYKDESIYTYINVLGQLILSDVILTKDVVGIKIYGLASHFLELGTCLISFLDNNRTYGEYPFIYEKWAAFGDSGVSAGFFENIVKNSLLLDRFDSLGVNGAPISGTGDNDNYTEANTNGNQLWTNNRVNTIPIDSDLVVILGGTNDMYQAYVDDGGSVAGLSGIGNFDISNSDVKTFVGAYNVLLSKIYYKFCKLSNGYYSNVDYSGITQVSEIKDIRILILVPFQFNAHTTLNNKDARYYADIMANAVKKISAMWSIPAVDLHGGASLNDFNISFTYQSDKIHPTKLGHKHISNLIISKAKECFLIR